MPDIPEEVPAAREAVRQAKDRLDAMEAELAHAQRIGKVAGLIALGRLLQCAEGYVAALIVWAEAMGE